MSKPARRPLAGSCLPLFDAPLDSACDPTQEVSVSVKLRRRSLEGMSGPEERAVHKGLDRAEYSRRYGGADEDVEEVGKFAAAHGLALTEADLARRHVGLTGTIADLNRAFGVALGRYRHPGLADLVRAHPGEVHVPARLDGVVKGVFGLDDLPVVRPHVRPFDAQQGGASATPFKPAEVAALYNFPAGVSGRGQSVAVLEFAGGYDPAVLDAYFQKFLGMAKAPTIRAVSVDGASNNPYGSSIDVAASAEVYLDVEILGAVAPDAEITVYFAPWTARGFVDSVEQAIHSGHAAISISWGENEDLDTHRPVDDGVPISLPEPMSKSLRENVDEALLDAYNLGVPVFVSAGDSGSSDTRDPSGVTLRTRYAHVGYPASSPWVTACGGTLLYAANGRVTKEVVWNELGRVETSEGLSRWEGGATGGGVSDEYPVPSFQKQAGLEPATVNPSPPFPTHGRGLPDVAGNAGTSTGYLVTAPRASEHDGIDIAAVGGTSAVAPLWAALVALVNEKLDRRVSRLNDFLYQNAGQGLVSIDEGDNTSAAAGGYEAAVSRWDPCTGWGRPDGQALTEALRSWTSRKKA